MHRSNITISIFVFGCVGYGLYQVLNATPGIKATIKHIVVKDRTKERSLPSNRFTDDRSSILDDPTVNVVFELTGDADAAYEIVTAAIRKGKALVTANNKRLAKNFAEPLTLLRAYGQPLTYEVSCCTIILVIRNLERILQCRSARESPTLDLELLVHRSDIPVVGITNVNQHHIRFAKEKEWKIKLVGRIERKPDGNGDSYVMPQLCHEQSPVVLC